MVVLTGAGMSAESGIRTFRGNDGLWEDHRIEDVATPEGWHRDPETVLQFYNQRRRQLYEVEPNAGHYALAKLQERAEVRIITQNIDNLHERAGSGSVLHLHGYLDRARSTVDAGIVYDLGGRDIGLGDCCERGSQLRPDVVWFGEEVPAMVEAAGLVALCDVLMVVGTSLQVYPAASLAHLASREARKILVDPDPPAAAERDGFEVWRGTAAGLLPERLALDPVFFDNHG